MESTTNDVYLESAIRLRVSTFVDAALIAGLVGSAVDALVEREQLATIHKQDDELLKKCLVSK